MTNITVYDPPMCCSTGICGTDIDQKIVNFAADLDWLKSVGVDVRRINLSQEPSEFVENGQVKDVLDKSGVEGLPVIFANEKMLSSGQYPVRKDLAEMAGVNVDKAAGEVADAGAEQSSGCCGGDVTAKSKDSGGCGDNGEAKQSGSNCC